MPFEISFSLANCTLEKPAPAPRKAVGFSPISRDWRISKMASATYETMKTISAFAFFTLTSVDR